MEDISLYSLIEVAIAVERGRPAVIAYRKLRSVCATNKLVSEHIEELARIKKKEDFVTNHPHLF